MSENDDFRVRGRELGDALNARHAQAFERMWHALDDYVGAASKLTVDSANNAYDDLVDAVNDFVLVQAECDLIAAGQQVATSSARGVMFEDAASKVVTAAKAFAEAHRIKYG